LFREDLKKNSEKNEKKLTLVGKELFGVVIDELTVDENIDVVLADHLNLFFHFLLFS
jgi:hypothetical protein